MKRRILASVILAGIFLAAVAGLWAVQPSLSQPPLADLLLRQSDLPAPHPHGTEWYPMSGQTPEELARAIGQPLGLSLEGTEFLEGQGRGFITYSDGKMLSIVQGLYRYNSARTAMAQYEQVLDGLAFTMGRETPITSQTEWSSGKARGQLIEALDPVGLAYAYWFIGVQEEWVMVMQVWACHLPNPSPDPSAKALLTEELLPKALKRLTGVP